MRLVFNMVTVNKLLKLQTETIFRFAIRGFDYKTIQRLFREVFVRHEYFFKTPKKKPVIFDCGANIGMTTLFFKWLYPKSEIHAFEPDKVTFKLLKHNVAQNKLENVYLYNVALSDKKRKVSLYIDKQQPGSTKMSIKFERMPKDKIFVEACPLSVFIQGKDVDLLKMDIEGAEMSVVRDLFITKKLQNVKEMIIEYHHNISGENAKLGRFLTFFEENGYKYQINTKCIPIYVQEKFQDVLIYAYKQ